MKAIIGSRPPAPSLCNPFELAAMMQNLVAGCVLLALVVMGVLAYAQKHDEFCERGHLLRTLKPCGSMSSSM